MGTLDENIDKAVAFLREYGPQKCSAVGDHLWPTAMGTSSNPQTRQAGRVLHAAKRQGLVREIDDRYRGTLWAAT